MRVSDVVLSPAAQPLSVTSSSAPARPRIASIDAYRGLVMFLMLAEVLRSCEVSAALPSSFVWGVVCTQQTHAAWVGSSLHDLIQPSFYFLVGFGLLLSMSRRLSSGQTIGQLARHTIVRSLVLVVLGMALVSVHPRHWTWWFDDTLTQIGLAYPFLFFIARRPKREWAIVLGVILAGYWLWFALSPAPPPGFDYDRVGVSAEWLNAHALTGFAAHWQKNSNVSSAFDLWFLNLFPQAVSYTGEPNGLTTLNFIPTIGTMVLGLFAADLLRSPRAPWQKVRWLFVAGGLLLGSGWLLGVLGVCPVVKAIWTPSWVIYSGGWCFLLLGAFYALVDVAGFAAAAFPLRVIGMNSIVAYSLSHLYPAFAFNGIRRVVGSGVFMVLGAAYEPFLYGCAILAMYWAALYLLYTRRIFLRV